MEKDDSELLRKILLEKTKKHVKALNKQNRYTPEEYVNMIVPKKGGFNSRPIGAGESGAGLGDLIKKFVSIPAKIFGLGEGEQFRAKRTATQTAKAKKPRKPRAKKAKGGSLLDTLIDAASDMPTVFKTPLDSIVPKDIQRGVARAIIGNGKAKAKKPAAAKKKSNPWLTHLAKVRKANEGLSLKEAMILAKQSYKN